MNKINYLILFLLIIVNGHLSFGQDRSFVKLSLSNGKEMFVSAIVTTFQGKLVFPSDDKKYIRCKVNDEKVKFDKSEINSIQLGNILYEKHIVTIRSREYSIFATQVTKGKLNVYKAFPYDHMSGVVGPGGTSQSINKIAVLQYYYLEDHKLIEADFKKDALRFSKECSAFSAYLKSIKKLKKKNFEEAVSYFNDNCNNCNDENYE